MSQLMARLGSSVKRAALTHHDPLRDDEAIDRLLASIRARLGENASSLDVFAAAEGQIVIAAELTGHSSDHAMLAPMLRAARCELIQAEISQPPGVVLADAGYWSVPGIEEIEQAGSQVLVPAQAKNPKGRIRRRQTKVTQMQHRLATEQGASLYRRRQQIIEPIYAHTKIGRRIDRFQRRGLSACRSEWRLIAATHNLLKLWRAQIATV